MFYDEQEWIRMLRRYCERLKMTTYPERKENLTTQAGLEAEIARLEQRLAEAQASEREMNAGLRATAERVGELVKERDTARRDLLGKSAEIQHIRNAQVQLHDAIKEAMDKFVVAALLDPIPTPAAPPMSDKQIIEEAAKETLAKVRFDKLFQKLFWYDNEPDDKTIVDYVHLMRKLYIEMRRGSER